MMEKIVKSYTDCPEAFLLGFFIIGLTFFLCAPHVSAYSIHGMTIDPQKNIVAGNPVRLSFTLVPQPWTSADFTHYTANPNGTIQIVTMLDNPSWVRNTVINGQASVQEITGTNILNLEGWDIAYRQIDQTGHEEMINITVTGTAPNISETGSVPFLTIVEYSEDGKKIFGSDQQMRYVVINPRDISSALYLAETDLKKYALDIKEQDQRGIDTTQEKILYTSAETSLNIARQLPPDQYLTAVKRLEDITLTIKSGKKSLDHQYTIREISKATVPLEKIDSIILWFHRNSSTKDYPGLGKIIAAQNNITALISSSTSLMENQEYEPARSQADDAYRLANTTLTDAEVLQKRAMDPLTPIWDNLLFIGIMGAIFTAAYLFKPRKKKGKKVEKDGNGNGNEKESAGS